MSNRNYRIALIHYSCPPVVGGVEEIVHQQASLFTRYGHEVKIFVGAGQGYDRTFEAEINPLLGSRTEEVLKVHQSIQEDRHLEMESLLGEVYEYLTKVLKSFDLLIAHNVITMPYNLPLTAALHRIGQECILPIISWNHDSPYFYPDYPEYLDRFPWNMLKRSYAGINYVAISESRKKMFSKLYGTKKQLSVVPNGIDPVGFFRLDQTTVRLIQEKHLFEADFLMVQPSRLHHRKNIELSIHVAKALQDFGCRATLLITGAHDPHEAKSMAYYNHLTTISKDLGIEDNVLIMAEHVFENGEKLTGDRIIIRDLYLIADILFLPSIQEGFGIPILESGMIKLPVVCSKIPPFLEIGGSDVCLFDLDDPPDKIAKKIIQFVDGLKPHKMFRKVMKEYSWDNIYNNRLLPLIKRLVDTKCDL